VAKAVAFYRDAFGWELARVEGAPGDRHSVRVGETLNGGIAAIPEAAGPDLPSHWLACFAVDDVPASYAGAEAAGGRPVSDVLELPGGRFAVVADPQGAAFGLIDGGMDP
jgi:predicted enzyme related to lactoylglutathione lyase